MPALGHRTPFYTRGEPREALVVQTIARGDGFVLPMRNGDELPSKPPLFHWLAAAACAARGHVDEASIRLPSIVAALAAMVATAIAAWTWWGAAASALTAIVLATSFQWTASSVSARVDMLLASLVTLALLLFARAVETGRRIPATVFVLLTAATLTKGPVGIVLPVAIALVTLAIRGELGFLGWREVRLALFATAAAAAWYAAAVVVGGEAFVAKQILKENVFRVIDPDSVDAGHVAPFWFYVPLLVAGLAPWSMFVPGLAAFVLTRRPGDPTASDRVHADEAVLPSDRVAPVIPVAAPVAAPEPQRSLRERMQRLDRHVVFALVWAILPFVLFSMAGSKRAVYLLPAFPAYAMLIAAAWTRLVRERPAPLATTLLLAGAAVSAAVVVLAAALVLAGTAGSAPEEWLRGLVSHADARNVAPIMEAMREHRAIVLPCAFLMLAGAWTTIRAARQGRWARVLAATAASMLALTTTVSTTLLPALAAKRSHRAFMQRVERFVPQTSPLSFYRSFDYGAVFYRGAPIPVRKALSDVPEIDGAWLLTQPAHLAALARELAQKPGEAARQLDTGANADGAAGAYEVRLATADGMKAFAAEDVDSSSPLVLVQLGRRADGQDDRDERAGGN